VSHAPSEIVPGVRYWSAPHPSIGVEVWSYWLDATGVLVDPLVPPDGGLVWFAGQPVTPTAIVLSNRHHSRHSDRFVERFHCPVLVPRAGLHEFTRRDLAVTPYDPGEELPGGLVVHEIGALCPDDMALHLPAAELVFFADGVVLSAPGTSELRVGFVPDSLMDDPPGTKRGLLASIERLLETVEFRHICCAHGGPLRDTGRAQLEEFVRVGGRTALEL
jgi:hypothetical protein